MRARASKTTNIKKPPIVTYFKCAADDHAKLKAIAENEAVPVSAVVRRLVREGLARLVAA